MKLSEKKLKWIQIPATVSLALAVAHTIWWGICAAAWTHFILNEGKTYWSSVVVAVICLGIGIVWIWKARQRIRFVRDCREYFVFLAGRSRISVEEFAFAVRDDAAKVRKNLITMISFGYIEGITLNVHDDCITVPEQARTKPVMLPVTCEACCGVTLLPPHSEGICDYCGSKIKS